MDREHRIRLRRIRGMSQTHNSGSAHPPVSPDKSVGKHRSQNPAKNGLTAGVADGYNGLVF